MSWKKGPSCWVKIAPTLFYAFAIIAYLIVPAALTIYTHEVWGQMEDNPFFLPIFVSLCQQLLNMTQYYLVIHTLIVPEAKAYLDQRERQRLLLE